MFASFMNDRIDIIDRDGQDGQRGEHIEAQQRILRSMKKRLNPIVTRRLARYIMAGPVYMRTRLTSSAIRLMRSPVLCVL